METEERLRFVKRVNELINPDLIRSEINARLTKRLQQAITQLNEEQNDETSISNEFEQFLVSQDKEDIDKLLPVLFPILTVVLGEVICENNEKLLKFVKAIPDGAS